MLAAIISNVKYCESDIWASKSKTSEILCWKTYTDENELKFYSQQHYIKTLL